MPLKTLISNWVNSTVFDLSKLNFFILAVFILSGCSFSNRHKHIHSHPEWKSEDGISSVRKLTVGITSNFQGHLNYHKEYIPSLNENLPEYFKVGGSEALVPYLEIFKKRYADTQIMVDTGHIYESADNKKKKDYILNIFNGKIYDAVAMTEQELLDFVDRQTEFDTKDVPFLASNIIDLATGEPISKGPILPYKIIERNGVKTGLVSITSFDSISQTERKKLNGVYFEDPVLSFLRIRKIFKKEGVHIIILLTHVETKCNSGVPRESFTGSDRSKHQLECPKGSDQLTKLIKRLPPDSVDLVISGDKEFAMGFVGNTPIMQVEGHGKWLGRVDLYYDMDQGIVLKNRMRFHSPTKLCHRFFVSTADCHIEVTDEKVKKKRHDLMQDTAFQLMTAKFLGHEIKINTLPPNLRFTNK